MTKINYKRAYLKELDRSKQYSSNLSSDYQDGKADAFKECKETFNNGFDIGRTQGKAEAIKEVEKIIDWWYNTSPCDGGNCKICKCRNFVKNGLKNIDVSNSLKAKIKELEEKT